MLKIIRFGILFVFSLSILLSAQQFKKLPLPQDISADNLFKAAVTAEAINKDIAQKEKKMFNYKTNVTPSYQFQGNKIITQTSIDKNLRTFNTLTSTIFTSLRKQYNYILKLENEIKKLQTIRAQEKKTWEQEKHILGSNIIKLKEQNSSYLKIFEKIKADNYNLQQKINEFQKALQNSNAKINQLENVIKSIHERLLKIKMLSTLGRE